MNPPKRRSPTNAAGSGAGATGGGSGAGGGAASAAQTLPWLQLLAVVLEVYPEGGCWRPQVCA